MSSASPATTTTHLAMWSGPRNISTAMMRSFESRPRTKVCDEPLYAHYLAVTKLPHPMADEIVERHEADWRKVTDELTAPLDAGTELYYQKHMAHHLLPEIGREWLERVTHAFLIRDPAEMLISLNKVLPSPRVVDTGLPQQLELFRELRARGLEPPVVDGRDVLEDPRGVLSRLCEALGLAFDDAMLTWAPGPRDTDGCWAEHWYANVFQTTGFGQWKPRAEEVPAGLEAVHEECRRAYDELRENRL